MVLPRGTRFLYAHAGGNHATFEINTDISLYEDGTTESRRLLYSQLSFLDGDANQIIDGGFITISNFAGIPYLDVIVGIDNADYPLPGSNLHIFSGIGGTFVVANPDDIAPTDPAISSMSVRGANYNIVPQSVAFPAGTGGQGGSITWDGTNNRFVFTIGATVVASIGTDGVRAIDNINDPTPGS